MGVTLTLCLLLVMREKVTEISRGDKDAVSNYYLCIADNFWEFCVTFVCDQGGAIVYLFAKRDMDTIECYNKLKGRTYSRF